MTKLFHTMSTCSTTKLELEVFYVFWEKLLITRKKTKIWLLQQPKNYLIFHFLFVDFFSLFTYRILCYGLGSIIHIHKKCYNKFQKCKDKQLDLFQIIRAGFLTPAAHGQINARRASKKCPPGCEGKCFIKKFVFLPL